ncbi:hypothetical protein AB6724_20375 [Comamonas guangdongensis]|uniref:Uncharacterized protein n=1 Tax=Comamonas guangdongensis TaxID=510515 RepID=A0ABV4A0N3_9BURK
MQINRRQQLIEAWQTCARHVQIGKPAGSRPLAHPERNEQSKDLPL